MIKFFTYICIFLFVRILAENQDFPRVRVEQGVIKGKYRQTKNGKTFNSFTGVPYAQPPVGELRFKSPLPGGHWEGVLDATKISLVCPQFENSEVIGSEDCLYLNVYTPQLESSKAHLLPVLLYIHGGSFLDGSGNDDFYGPDILLDRNVVLVTINYRLGALGFLSTEDEIIPGNYGLKDQNLAIKWTNKNIIHFGGNPDKITIFGQSSGGASVHYQLLSPLSKGLFSGAIAHSGAVTEPWAIEPKGQAVKTIEQFAKSLDCTRETKVEMVKCLKKAEVKDIVVQQMGLIPYEYGVLPPFMPIVEPNSDEAFIFEDPIDIIISGKSMDVPFICGVTTEEGAIKSSILYQNSLIEELDKNFEKLAPLMFLYENNTKKEEITRKIRHFYFGNKSIDGNTRAELTDLFTDPWFLVPQAMAIQLHAKYSTHPVYHYIFGIHGRLSFSKLFGDPDHDYGVCHGDELFYLFSNELFPGFKPNATEKKCSDIMTNMWSVFALTGNQTPAIDSLIRNKWETTKSDALSSYFFRNVNDIKMVKDIYKERIEFWKSLDINPAISRIVNELQK